MSESRPSESSPAATPEREPEWKRQRRLASIFGDVLPEQTSDDATNEGGAERGESAGDRWLREQVPPHHGG